MANRLYEAITAAKDVGFDIAEALAAEGIEIRKSGFHGYRRLDFALPGDGAACTIVQPHTTRTGHPWVWRARFFGHQPKLDIALLNRGYHLVYCDVANLFGAPRAVARWNTCYEFVRKLGLGPKALLEGMSRGGLIIFNWASANPGKVAAIYGDNPVCDFRSWPAGQGSGKKALAEWERCKQAYGLDAAQAETYDRLPVNEEVLRPIARAGIPVFLVLGTADQVVPPAENGDVVERRYQALGGPIEVIRKNGLGHHPHGLEEVGPLLRALLAATGQSVNWAAMPLPSAEFRGKPAGWGGGTWWDQVARMNKLTREHAADIRIAFFGDSITQSWTGSGDRLAHPDGSRTFDRYYGKRGAVSLGLSGDRTEHLLYRIDHGAFDAIDPAVVVVMVGVNNIHTGGHTGREVAAGTRAIVKRLRSKEPQAKLIVLGCFPSGAHTADNVRAQGRRLHELIRDLHDDRNVFYLDLRDRFLLTDGRMNHATMGKDNVHITPKGYEAWAEGMEPLMARLLGEAE
jgi:lysophospholipase L1-like esterase/pimeloyl-ACP methyl ester carboxylesterase